MRAVFISPSVEEFRDILDIAPAKVLRGGSLQDIEIFRAPGRSARGSGLFSSLAGLARRVIPFIAKAVKPTVVEFGRNVLTDLQDGNVDLRSSLKRRGIEALKTTGRRLVTGEGRKRKKKTRGYR